MSVHVVSKLRMLACSKKGSLLYRKGKLYIGDSSGQNACFLTQVPNSPLRRMLTGIRLTERLLRLEPRVACCVDETNYLLSCCGSIYYVDTKKRELRKELSLRIGMNNPLSFTKRQAGAYGQEILFGEYFSNNRNESVSIFRRCDGAWSKVYSFPAGEVYHIHGIVADDAMGRIYILTGDKDRESAIWCTADDFQTVEPLVRGNQQYRSCVAFATEGSLIYATDTPREQNWIYRLYRDKEKWVTVPICKLPGPCIYGAQRNNGWYFATSVEGDDTLSPLRYRFSSKLGAGVQDRYSYLIFYGRDGTTCQLEAFRKDALPMLLFQFGNCSFPEAPMDAPLLCTPQSVKHYDGNTICIESGAKNGIHRK